MRCFPIIYVTDVPRAVDFYTKNFGFTEQFRFPEGEEAGYVALARDGSDLGIVDQSSPQQLINRGMGSGAKFELFIYVDDVDVQTEQLRAAGASVLRDPQDMPWGERLAYAEDPEGNPIAIAAQPRQALP
jgi:lactoylglutathione lyase